MAYSDTGSDAGAADPLPAYDDYGGSGGGFKSKIFSNFEGLIPLLLIVVIGFFLLSRLDILTTDMPVIGPIVSLVSPYDSPKEMLILGSPSTDTLNVLNENRRLVNYTVRKAEDLERNPKEQLSDYSIVFLDQSNQQDKSVSFELGEALTDWVKKGGKLVLIKDSGIYRPGTYDVIGWKSTFLGTIPVGCERLIEGKHSCTTPVTVRAQIVSQKRDHPIMKGIDRAPAREEDRFILTTFPVERIGTELAYIESDTGETYTAIVESKLVIGKVLYFNYDPGMTRGIFEQTLKYLR
ncbi:MAG: hypothetical protein Q7K42_00370 [Candidatus Diapherotrites archaeon]|nr:hypothetical protein [Candidatus Diapherotrites archaeon]